MCRVGVPVLLSLKHPAWGSGGSPGPAWLGWFPAQGSPLPWLSMLEPLGKMHCPGMVSRRTLRLGASCEGARVGCCWTTDPAGAEDSCFSPQPLLQRPSLGLLQLLHPPSSCSGTAWGPLHPWPVLAWPQPPRGTHMATLTALEALPACAETRAAAQRVGIHHTFISEYPSQNQPQH